MKLNKIFVTSDTHYLHENIIKYCNRPFSSIEEMNEVLVLAWNSVVPTDGLVFHLGDVSIDSKGKNRRKWKQDQLDKILPRLNGEKHLILGNHDQDLKDYFKTHFKTVKNYQELTLGDKKFVLFHYPMESWNGSYHGSIHLHGHTHGTLRKMKNRIDVGVDCNKIFAPFSMSEINILLNE